MKYSLNFLKKIKEYISFCCQKREKTENPRKNLEKKRKKMDEIAYNRMCEDAAYGDWLVQTIADSIGIEPNIKKIERAIYKYTDCGAWVRFDEKGIIVGTIVEGSDAEYSERIDLPQDDNPEELCKRFWNAIENCENFAIEHFGQTEFFGG